MMRRSARDILTHPAVRLLLVAAIVVLAIVQWVPFPWRMPLVALLAIAIVRAEAGTIAPIGLRWPLDVRTTFAWALGLALATIALSALLEPLFERLTGVDVDYTSYGALRDNASLVARLTAAAWLSAAIGEELVFRGFLLHELGEVVGTRGTRRAGVVLASAALFGLAHANQELPGVLLTASAAILFGAAFFASGRNIVALMLAHGLVDTWGLFTLYLGWY